MRALSLLSLVVVLAIVAMLVRTWGDFTFGVAGMAVAVADALAAAPYDEARLRAAIDDFNRNGTTVLSKA